MPPRLGVEVVSPGAIARTRDYERKRAQYEAIGIPAYWIIDPEQQAAFFLSCGLGLMDLHRPDEEAGRFAGTSLISSGLFSQAYCRWDSCSRNLDLPEQWQTGHNLLL